MTVPAPFMVQPAEDHPSLRNEYGHGVTAFPIYDRNGNRRWIVPQVGDDPYVLVDDSGRLLGGRSFPNTGAAVSWLRGREGWEF
jgi:hypothetical protein